MREILLTQGMVALVDDEDFERVSQWRWTISNGYATRRLKRDYSSGKPKQRDQKMHRFIMGEPSCQIDHINQNKLDNRKENLRPCSISENRCNIGLKRNNKSGFKGVSYDSSRQRWIMQIRKGKTKIQKLFKSKEEAAKAYNFYAEKLHKEFAFINKGIE